MALDTDFETPIVRQAARAMSDALEDDLDRSVGAKNWGDSYFPPSSDWLLYDKNRLIRLDVAVEAIHLAAARVYFKPLPHVVSRNLARMKEIMETIAVEVLSLKVLSGVAGFAFRIFLDLVECWKTQQLNRDLERSIHINFAKVMRDLQSDYLSQAKRKDHTKVVSTRHPSKKQRRENGGSS